MQELIAMMLALKTFLAIKYPTATMLIIKNLRMLEKNGFDLPLDVFELYNSIKKTTRTLPLALMDGLSEVPAAF